jgi:hypothetical protein
VLCIGCVCVGAVFICMCACSKLHDGGGRVKEGGSVCSTQCVMCVCVCVMFMCACCIVLMRIWVYIKIHVRASWVTEGI